MRVAGWHVSGFGHLADLELHDLPNGLVVFHGPNEAGKSTLVDFLTGMMFGFPRGSTKLTKRPPIRGGSHGGKLWVTDGSDSMLITRSPRELVVRRHSDDAVLTEAELSIELGGATRSLFEAVFSVNLDALASLDALDDAQLNDLLFSAGVVGAGRSASNVLAKLETRQQELYRRQGRSDNYRVVALRAELREAEAQLGDATRAAGGVPQLRRARSHAEAEATRLRGELEELADRHRHLGLLIDLWPVHVAAAGAAAELSHLGSYLKVDPATLGQLEAIEAGIGEAQSAVSEAERLVTVARQQADAVVLAPNLLAVQADVGLLEQQLALQLRDRAAAAEAAESAALAEQRLADQLARLGPEVDRAWLSAWAGDLGTVDSIDSAAMRLERARELEGAALHELRTLQAQRDQHQSRLTARIESLRAEGLEPGRRAGRARQLVPAFPVAPLVVVALLLVLLVAALAGPAASSLAAIALLCGLGFWSIAARSDRGGEAARSQALAATSREMAELEASDAAVIAVANDRAAHSTAERVEAERNWAGVLVEARLPTDLSAVAARQFCDLAMAAQGNQREADRLAATSQRLSAGFAEFAYEIRSVAARAFGSPGLSEPIDLLEKLRLAVARATTASEAAAEAHREVERRRLAYVEAVERAAVGVAALDALVEKAGAGSAAELREAAEVSARARELESKVADLHYAVVLGSGEAGSAAVTEALASGDPEAWRAERSRVEGERAELEASRDVVVAECGDLQRRLTVAQESSDVASASLVVAGVRSELRSAVREWMVLGLAKGLVSETLARYQRERQPRVLARAQDLFAMVTAGRYAQLRASDGVVVAVDSSGTDVAASALSRGTREQLYLCLRFALAECYAERVPLPILLDDVLVNFDDVRAPLVAKVIASVAERQQVLAFTCNAAVRDLLVNAAPSATVVPFDRSTGVLVPIRGAAGEATAVA